MRRVRYTVLLGLVAMFSVVGQAQQRQDDMSAVADFASRIKAYVTLRDSLEKGAAELSETASPEEIAAAEAALAARIRAARPDAKRGDLFTSDTQAHIRRLLKPEMQGLRGRNTRGIIQDEGPGPGAFPFTVNGPYPKNQPHGTVPANLLELLPPLPEGLEYRFVDRALLIRDTRANLIVDYMPNAIP
jgi:hypothetical protein